MWLQFPIVNYMNVPLYIFKPIEDLIIYGGMNSGKFLYETVPNFRVTLGDR